MTITWPETLTTPFGGITPTWTLSAKSTRPDIQQWAQYRNGNLNNVLHAMEHSCGALDVWVDGDFIGFAASPEDIPALFGQDEMDKIDCDILDSEYEESRTDRECDTFFNDLDKEHDLLDEVFPPKRYSS